MRQGFSLTELLVVVALTIVIGSAGFLLLANQRGSSELKNATAEVTAFLREAQQNALSDPSTSWGVRFDNTTSTSPRVLLFAADTFAESKVKNSFTLGDRVMFPEVLIPGGEVKDIIFTRGTGYPATADTVTVASRADESDSVTISISAIGVIGVAEFAVTAIDPSEGIAEKTFYATITGSGFQPGAMVFLGDPGGLESDIFGVDFTVTPTEITGGYFELNTVAPESVWNVAVLNPDGQIALCESCFTVVK